MVNKYFFRKKKIVTQKISKKKIVKKFKKETIILYKEQTQKAEPSAHFAHDQNLFFCLSKLGISITKICIWIWSDQDYRCQNVGTCYVEQKNCGKSKDFHLKKLNFCSVY